MLKVGRLIILILRTHCKYPGARIIRWESLYVLFVINYIIFIKPSASFVYCEAVAVGIWVSCAVFITVFSLHVTYCKLRPSYIMISWRDRLMRCCDTMLIMLRLPSQRLIRSIAVTIRGPGARMSPTFSSPPPSISKESKSPPATSHAKTLLPPCYYANATALLQPC